jgi:2-iminobutanoate/2-iminopropanoate deaminase
MKPAFLDFADAPPPPPTAAYSHAVRAGQFLFVTGQLGVDPKTGKLVTGGAAAQAERVMRNLEIVLAAAGARLANTAMARIYLVDFKRDYPVVNRIYAARFGKGSYPARTTVGVTHLALDGLVEIDLVVRL